MNHNCYSVDIAYICISMYIHVHMITTLYKKMTAWNLKCVVNDLTIFPRDIKLSLHNASGLAEP